MSRVVRSHQRSGRQAFTLIELLVVISIISLLVAVLLPMLAQARAQAVILRCMAMHRDLSMGCIYYMNDNRDYFPINQYYRSVTMPKPSSSDALLAWQLHPIATYLNIPDPQTFTPETVDTNYAKFYYCPAETEKGNNSRYSIESSFGRVWDNTTGNVINPPTTSASFGRLLSGWRITEIGRKKGVPPQYNYVNVANPSSNNFIPWYFGPRDTPMYWDGRFTANPTAYVTAAVFDKDYPSHYMGLQAGARFNLAFADGSARTMNSNYNSTYSFRDNSWYPEWWKN